MDIQLYVYDLTRGLARQMSRQFLGIQIDAVYHTSLVFGGVEYFFGAGVQTCYAGMTHHGRPMEVITMGRTELPMEIILDYLDSLRQTYTAESYDLFAHNCNNFTNDFAMFLVGKGIPNHITSLPKRVLETPFGQMLKPQIDQAMRPVTQGLISQRDIPRANSSGNIAQTANGTSRTHVHSVSDQKSLDRLLDEAKSSCAVIFFTSNSCGPCKMMYPTYNELAEEVGSNAILIKVDISVAQDIASAYSIRATPTFVAYLKGKQEETWSGADPERLKATIRMLVQSAFPPHRHENLKLPLFRRSSVQPVVYSKLPPLDKLIAKMGDLGKVDIIGPVVDFVKSTNSIGKQSQETPLPDLATFSALLEKAIHTLPLENLFVIYDLFRLVLIDARAAGYFAQGAGLNTTKKLLGHVANVRSLPYNLQLVTLHLICNLTSHQIFNDHSLAKPEIQSLLVNLLNPALLGNSKATLRVAATSLSYNIATANYLYRERHQRKACILTESLQVELGATLLEGLSAEQDSPEATRGMTLALARLVYGAPEASELLDLCRAMDAKGILMEKKEVAMKDDWALIQEIAEVLLTNGL